jgi:exodeoxyribonuclease V gamma subunit
MALAANIDRLRSAKSVNLFESPRIIVPNLNVAAYLKFEFARLTGISANLRFLFLEKFLTELVESSTEKVIIIDRGVIQSLLLGLFSGTDKDASLPAEIAAYLSSHGGSEDSLNLRRFQLAANLSHVFEEYCLSRPEMIDTWDKGRATISRKDVKDTERWQISLWGALFGPNGSVRKAGEVKGSRFIFYKDIPSVVNLKVALQGGPLHLFGFSYVSRTFNLLLDDLSKAADVYVYTLNPCLEFWEDVATKPEFLKLQKRLLGRANKMGYKSALDQEDPFHLSSGSDTPALRLWGRPGRENIHILNEFTSCDFSALFRDPLEGAPKTLLRRIRHDILLREPERTKPPEDLDLADDKSLMIIECPEIRREVEIIANEIWALIMENSTSPSEEKLRFSDIAVVIADSGSFDSYKTHIADVFSEIHDIPHNLSDISFAGENRMVEAVDLLLSLPLSVFTRKDLLKLLSHPAVLVRFPEADAEEWLGWCQQTSILHGIDREDHKNTYIEKDLFNWDQGLRRLVLGAFLTGERSGEKEVFRSEENGMGYIPEDHAQGSLPNSALFILLVRSLMSDTRFIRESRLSLIEWSDFLVKFMMTYLGADSPESEHVLSRCIGEVCALRNLDLEGRKYPFRIAKEFVSSAISSIRGSRGQYLAGGVTVSSFQPMRPIPFRVVFIAGMGESCFPAPEMKNPLDLRLARRMMGDVSPRERDQYNFLETLVSTRERLYLSYVSRDSQTGERLEPSSVIKELLFILERGYVKSKDLAGIVVGHPLRRYDGAYFPSLFGSKDATSSLPNFSPPAFKEAQTVALREELKVHLTGGGLSGDLNSLQGALKGRLENKLGFSPVPTEPVCIVEESIQVPVHAIRRFLDCPLQGWATYELGLREEETESLIELTDEPFETPRIDSVPLLRKVFIKALKDGGLDKAASLIPEIYEKEISFYELKGVSPTGLFLRAEGANHLATIEAWHANFCSLGLKPEESTLEVIRFGRAEEDAEVGRLLPAISLETSLGRKSAESRMMKIDLYGKTENVNLRLPGSFTFIDKDRIEPHEFLRGFLDYVFLSLLGIVEGEYRVTVISKNLSGSGRMTKTIAFSPLRKEKAESYLSLILSQLVSKSHMYLLPVEAVVTHEMFNKKGETIGDIVSGLKENSWTKYSSLYGPVPHPEDFDAPPENEASEMVSERFGLFFGALVKQWETSHE